MSDEEKASGRLEDVQVIRDLGGKPADDGDLDIDLETYGEEHGYPLDVAVLKEITPKWEQYQLSQDSRTVLIPQPSSDDPNDPLTWSWKKKHILLFVIAATAFLPDYGSAVGAVTLLPQST